MYMKKSKPLQIYLNDIERGQLETLRSIFGTKTLSGTVKTLIKIFYKIRVLIN